MKTGIVSIERFSIWCPGCCQFVESPNDGISSMDEVDYSKLPRVIICSSCKTSFRRPQITFSRRGTTLESCGECGQYHPVNYPCHIVNDGVDEW